MADETVARLQARRDHLRVQVSSVQDMRPGSLVERFRRCGKRSCHCAQEGSPGHGPSFSLTRAVGGKTVTRIIPASAVSETQEQLAEYRRFRQLTQELIEANERLCDARLSARKMEGAEKGGFVRRSRRRLRARSKRS
jgi:hypothetical protein